MSNVVPPLKSWDVFRPARDGRLIRHDTVFMDAKDADTVRLSLIRDEGLPRNIVVKKCSDIHRLRKH